MTGEASSMAVWNRLEGPLLQPECVAQVLRRLSHVLVAGLALRLIGLMTNRTVRWGLFLLLASQRDRNKRWSNKRNIATDNFKMSFVWKMYCELTARIPLRLCGVSYVAQTRKQETRSVTGRYRNVAVRTDSWRRPLAREELLPVAIQTCGMFRKFGDICKSGVPFTNFLPICSRELVARITSKLFFGDVRSMGEV